MRNLVLFGNVVSAMLMIRLQRVGRKHEPIFRLVLTDSKNSTKSGKFLEILGSFDSRKDEEAKFDNEKILRHISKGAQLSDTVHNLLLKRGVIQGTKRNVLSRKPLVKAAELAPVEKAEEPKSTTGDGENNSPPSPSPRTRASSKRGMLTLREGLETLPQVTS